MSDSTDSERQPKSSRSPGTRPLSAVTEPALLTAAGARTVRRFPYLATGAVEPDHIAILRPALPVTLLGGHGGSLTTARALVDSGADYTTFSDQWAQLLGIDLEKDCKKIEVAIADGRSSIRYAFTKGLQVEIVGERLFLPVAMFCKGLPIALLGRRDFFRRYLVLVDQSHFQIFLERLADPDEHDSDLDDDDEMDAALALS